MSSEELLEKALKMPLKGRSVYAQYRPAGFALREKGYNWREIAEILIGMGEVIPNVDSFQASLSKAWNAHIRKLTEQSTETCKKPDFSRVDDDR